MPLLSFAPRRDPNFLRFWSGQTFSAFGDAFAVIAIPLLVLDATGSLRMMGVVTALAGISAMLTGIFCGALVDRVDRRRLMVVSDLARVVLCFIVPAVWWWHGPHLWVVIAVAMLLAAFGMLFGVTYVTAVPNLVDMSTITQANGLLGASESLAYAIGPAVAGLVIAEYGAPAAIGIDGITFLVSAATLISLRFRTPQAAAPPREERVLDEFTQGVRFLASSPLFRWITATTAVILFFVTGLNDLVIFYVKEQLLLGDLEVGIVFAFSSIGAVVCGLTIAKLRERFGFGWCYLFGTLIEGVALIVVGFGPGLVVLSLVMLVASFSGTIRGTLTMTIRQELTPDHLLGRVTAAFWTSFMLPGAIGTVVMTGFGARVGSAYAMGVIGAMLVLVALIGLRSVINRRMPTLAG